MANNFFISYDLDKPGQHYDRVTAAIHALGNYTKVHMSLYYVKSNLSAEDIANRVRKSMDSNDRLIVIDASTNNAYWYNTLGNSSDFMQQNWGR